ncbi:MAG: hypothetical protein Q8Q02_12555 [Nocardioides sp.]|nr:hypothetical protein [Nocardioides sp.]
MPYDNKRPPSGPGRGGPATGVPARDAGTLPPFPPGNTLATTHGARSPRVYLPLAADLAAGLLDARPDLAPYPVAVARWAEWEARALLMRRHLAEVGDLGDDGDPRGSTRWLKTCETHAERAAAVLGLDPRSEASLARERAAAHVAAVDVHALAATGAAILAARDADPDAPPPEPDPVALALERFKAEGQATWERAAAEHNGRTTDPTTETTDPTTERTSEPTPGGER